MAGQVASDRKISEGLEHIRQAEKCLKTSLFKWKPDHDGASSEYTKAATCFKNAKAYEEAKECYVKAAESQKHMNSPFHAAKSYEQAGLICKENKELSEAADLMEQAAFMFQENGTPDTAALTLEKGAKFLEEESPDRAIYLYTKAVDVSEIEDKPRQCAEAAGKAARLLIKCGRLDEAVEMIKKEMEFYAQVDNYATICKLVLALVLLHLHRGDYVAADQSFKSSLSYPGFGESEESIAAEELLTAYDSGDEEKARIVLGLPLFKYMDNAFAKLARDLRLPEGGSSGGRSTGGEGQDDDEFAGGLC
ncbi:gamma-soluble NSF attachment protein-like [Liolophura sinensis]|uniref:gamma-soluble NSF attachment protein-like n=1 Tax=Liolophura sinensis TaxID=3198878 RepID=UPI0031598108